MRIGATRILVAITGLLVAAAFTPPAAEAASKKLIFELADARGDDFGDGSLIYPLRREFERGDLDLLALRAFRESDGTRFEATFANPIRKPGGETIDDLGTQLDSIARYGFYTFNLDIYIKTDVDKSWSSTTMLPGRKAVVSDDAAWDRAVVLTPRPPAAHGALRRQVIRTLEADMASEENFEGEAVDAMKDAVPADLDEKVFFPTRIRVRGSTVSFFVPGDFLGGPAQADWSYVVAVTGSDLLESTDLAASAGLAEGKRDSLMVLPVSPGTWQNRFGGGRDGQDLQPPLVDIIVPAGMSQQTILGDFSSQNARPAKLPGVIPGRSSGS